MNTRWHTRRFYFTVRMTRRSLYVSKIMLCYLHVYKKIKRGCNCTRRQNESRMLFLPLPSPSIYLSAIMLRTLAK